MLFLHRTDLDYSGTKGDDPAPAPLWVVVLPEGGRLGVEALQCRDVLVHRVQLLLVDPKVAIRYLLLILGGSEQLA